MCKLKLLQSRLPKCPHDGCKSELKVDDCKKFLTSELFDILNQRIVEASIDPSDKIYCPYPACSALMLRSENPGTSGGIRASVRECTKCHKRFCIDCKVSWHDNMTCLTYKQQNPPPPEDTELKSLATKSPGRQCPKCSHMVSLGEGCNHIYCSVSLMGIEMIMKELESYCMIVSRCCTLVKFFVDSDCCFNSAKLLHLL